MTARYAIVKAQRELMLSAGQKRCGAQNVCAPIDQQSPNRGVNQNVEPPEKFMYCVWSYLPFTTGNA